MSDGEIDLVKSSASTSSFPEASPSLSTGFDDDQAKSNSRAHTTEKDPRKIARKYQLELCKKAMEENIIVYLGTGCGKTHIAVLLIYELGHLIKRPQENICVFLAPTVALVQQQAKVIEDSTDFKVGICSGNSKRLKSHEYWEKEMKQYEVLVMTPQILVHCLCHCLIKMDSIALLIFDECHHAQVNSNHPYAEVMRVFYRADAIKRPRIFGMTASPVIGKGASSEGNLAKSINSLESLLDAKVYSVEDKNDVESFVASATVKIYYYGPVVNGTSGPYRAYYIKLGDLKRECVSELSSKKDDLQSLRSSKKLLNKLHDNIIFCLENLGVWGALQAIRILLNHFERDELMEAEADCRNDSLCDRYLAQAADVLAADCTRDIVGSEVLKEPFFSGKLLRLIGILSSYRLQPNMKCIVFVNRLVTARSLSYILQSLEFLASWKCHFLVGINSGLKNASRKTMKIILEKFRSGEPLSYLPQYNIPKLNGTRQCAKIAEHLSCVLLVVCATGVGKFNSLLMVVNKQLNLLIATKVGEEGLDIQTCGLVIRFDLPETVSSFIQSRGRARMPQSEYAFLVDRGNQKDLDLIENFQRDELQMNFEIACRTSNEMFSGLEEKVYKVGSSGASISSAYSISLLHQYCSKLPHDEYFDPKPKFFYLDDLEGFVCHIVLPSNAPVHLIVGEPQSSSEAAKKDACLKAIEELHKLGVFNDYLLPMQDNSHLERSLLNSSDSDNCEDESPRVELHEMLVPALLKESWRSSNIIYLYSYYIEFMPDPADRIYKKFGLFLKESLPIEAEKLELELHLARGRSVMTKLVPSDVVDLYEDEITLAEKFQEMFLKVILDRMEFVAEYVPLGKDFSESNSSTFYLLLPVNFHHHENALSIDWKTIRKCLSSPVFRSPENTVDKKFLVSKDTLQLADDCRKISDIENSLVYVPHKKGFYFIANVVNEKNGHSPCEESRNLSYMEDFIEKFGIQLKYPEQPLLQAKPLFFLHNLLHNRRHDENASNHLDEYFIYLPPELCQLKIIGFSKDIGSSISLLPSLMQRLENLLVAIELRQKFSVSFPEGSEVTVCRVLEAITTERCQEGFSLERLEILGDAFLKFAVARQVFLLHGTLDEGQLTKKRSNIVSNLNLFKLACKRNLQVYIRDQIFDPCQFFALGRSCPVICDSGTEKDIHAECLNSVVNKTNPSDVRCSKGHHWLHKKTVADVLEALVGAFIVDSGFKAATAFLKWIGIEVDFEASQVIDVCAASARYIPLAAQINIRALEDLLGYQFLHKGLLIQAFVHPSYNKHGGGCYQRLEFLGDAVLDYLITSYMYSVYPKLKPGQLTDLRSVFVNNQAFANVAADRSFQKFLISDSSNLSKAINKYVDFIKAPPSESSLDDWPKCPKALGDLVESCVGSILLDTGFNLNRIWVIMLSFLDPIIRFSGVQISPIRELQELCQYHSWDPPFKVSEKGNMYLVEAKVNRDNVCATASATNANIKEAKKIAAERLFEQLKDQGFTLKSSSLEKALKSSSKMEAKLIGYDEIPIDVAPPHGPIELENLTLEEPFVSKFVTKVRSTNEPMNGSSCKPAARRQPQSNGLKTIKNFDSDMKPQTRGTPQTDTATARSRLYEVCTANCWKPPLFECCDEEGPGHLKLFTYKALVEIEEAPDMILECFSSAHSKKKAAAEHAAEGALWFLKQQGYFV